MATAITRAVLTAARMALCTTLCTTSVRRFAPAATESSGLPVAASGAADGTLATSLLSACAVSPVSEGGGGGKSTIQITRTRELKTIASMRFLF